MWSGDDNIEHEDIVRQWQSSGTETLELVRSGGPPG